MKSRIAVCIFSITLAVLSVSLGGCSGSNDQSASINTSNIIEENSDNRLTEE